MKQQEQNKIYVGLKFTSVHFSADGEVVAIRETSNEVDVKLISSEGFAHIEIGWDLRYTKTRFECGEYIPIDPKEVNISII